TSHGAGAGIATAQDRVVRVDEGVETVALEVVVERPQLPARLADEILAGVGEVLRAGVGMGLDGQGPGDTVEEPEHESGMGLTLQGLRPLGRPRVEAVRP